MAALAKGIGTDGHYLIISNMANDSTANTTAREKCLADHRKKLLEHRELEAKLKKSKYSKLGLDYFYISLRR